MHLLVLDLLSKDHGEGRLLHTHVCTPRKLEGEGGGGGLIIKVVPGGTDSRRIVVLGMMASSVLKRRVLISDVMFFSSKLLWKRALASTQGGSSIKKTLPDPGQDIELLQLESTSNVFFVEDKGRHFVHVPCAEFACYHMPCGFDFFRGNGNWIHEGHSVVCVCV